MTPAQISLVQSSWQAVTPLKDQAAAMFYRKLFDLDATLEPLFKSDLTSQGRKLTTMIDFVVARLDRLAEIVPAVQDLGRRHVVYGVRDEYYDTVAVALLWTLSACLGETFTREVKDAWTNAYVVLAGAMKEAPAMA
jgi:hemoglobin-like flavoprotein